MSVRDRMHQLINQMPEERVRALEMLIALAMADDDDEPVDPEDEPTYDADWEEYLKGETMSAEEGKRQFLE